MKVIKPERIEKENKIINTKIFVEGGDFLIKEITESIIKIADELEKRSFDSDSFMSAMSVLLKATIHAGGVVNISDCVITDSDIQPEEKE